MRSTVNRKKNVCSFIYIVICSLLAATLTSCSAISSLPFPSPSSFLSSESGVGALSGGVTGAGIGYAIGQAVGDTTTNVVVNAAIGTATGAIAGAIVNQYAREARAAVDEKEELISKNHAYLETLRREMNDSSANGSGEVAPWEERYWDYSPSTPYQGTVYGQ